MAGSTQELELLIKAKQQTDAAFKAVIQNLAGTEKAGKGAAGSSKLLAAAQAELRGKLDGLSGSAGAVGNILTKMGPAGLAGAAGVGAIVVAVGALGKWTADFAGRSDALLNTATQIRWSTDALQEWTFAAEDVGGSSDTITAAAGKLNRALAEGTPQARAWAEQMGLGFDEIRAMKPEQQFDAWIKGLRGMADQGRAEGIAYQSLGRDARILRVMRSDTDSLRKSAHDYNAVMSGETLAAAGNLNTKLEKLGGAWTTLKDNIVRGIAESPEAAKAIDDIAKSLASMSVDAAKAAPGVVKAIGDIITALKTANEWAEKFDKWLNHAGQEKPTGGTVGGVGLADNAMGRFWGDVGGAFNSAFGSGQNGVPSGPVSIKGPSPADLNASLVAALQQGAQTPPLTADPAIIEAQNKLRAAQLQMLPIIDRENGALEAQVQALQNDATATVANIREKERQGDIGPKTAATVIGLTNATAAAGIAALRAADAQKRADEQLAYSQESARAFAEAQAALSDEYTQQTLAIQSQAQAQKDEIGRKYELRAGERAARQAKVDQVAALQMEVLQRDHANKLMQDAARQANEVADSEAALQAAVMQGRGEYERAAAALTRANAEKIRAILLDGTLGPEERRAALMAAAAAGANAQAQLAVNEAYRKRAELLQGIQAISGELDSTLQALGVHSEAASGALGGIGKMAGGLETFAKGGPVNQILGGLQMLGGAAKTIGSIFGGSEGQKTNDLRDQYMVAAGGASELARQAHLAGLDIEAIQRASTREDFKKAWDELQKGMADAQKTLRKTREDAIAAAGGTERFSARLKEAGYDIAGLFAADSLENFNKTLDMVTKGIEKQEGAYGDAQAAADRWGLSVEQTGKLAQMKLDETASSMLKDWELLKAMNADMGAVADKMGGGDKYKAARAKAEKEAADSGKTQEEIVAAGAAAGWDAAAGSMSAYLDGVRKSGAEIPEDMRPMLEAMAKSGELVDATGKAITDLSGFNFTENITRQFRSLIDEIRELVNAIRGVPAAAQGLAIPADSRAVGSMAAGYAPDYTGVLAQARGRASQGQGESWTAPAAAGVGIDAEALAQAVYAGARDGVAGISVQFGDDQVGAVVARTLRNNAGGSQTAAKEVVS